MMVKIACNVRSKPLLELVSAIFIRCLKEGEDTEGSRTFPKVTEDFFDGMVKIQYFVHLGDTWTFR